MSTLYNVMFISNIGNTLDLLLRYPLNILRIYMCC